jgi:hypothetical protein
VPQQQQQLLQYQSALRDAHQALKELEDSLQPMPPPVPRQLMALPQPPQRPLPNPMPSQVSRQRTPLPHQRPLVSGASQPAASL